MHCLNKYLVGRIFLLFCLCSVAVGCAVGESDEAPTASTEDTGSGTEPDAGPQGDPDVTDHGPDVEEEPPPAVFTPTIAPSGGGATLETSNHQIRLLVGPRGSAETLETPGYRIRMGAGNVQHAQDSE